MLIETNEELERLTRRIEPLLDKGGNRTPEEDALCRLALKLIDDYQRRHPRFPSSKPHELLQAVMIEVGLRQADLLDIFGSLARVSAAVHGKRPINKEQAEKLGARFSLSPIAFVDPEL